MNKNILLVVLLLAVSLGCKKEDIIVAPPILLSEIIYGDWEIRETINFLVNRDFEFHPLTGPPYEYYRFFESNEYEIWYLDNPITITSPFIVSDQDSTITLNDLPVNVLKFDEKMIELKWNGERDGQRLYRKTE